MGWDEKEMLRDPRTLAHFNPFSDISLAHRLLAKYDIYCIWKDQLADDGIPSYTCDINPTARNVVGRSGYHNSEEIAICEAVLLYEGFY